MPDGTTGPPFQESESFYSLLQSVRTGMPDADNEHVAAESLGQALSNGMPLVAITDEIREHLLKNREDALAIAVARHLIEIAQDLLSAGLAHYHAGRFSAAFSNLSLCLFINNAFNNPYHPSNIRIRHERAVAATMAREFEIAYDDYRFLLEALEPDEGDTQTDGSDWLKTATNFALLAHEQGYPHTSHDALFGLLERIQDDGRSYSAQAQLFLYQSLVAVSIPQGKLSQAAQYLEMSQTILEDMEVSAPAEWAKHFHEFGMLRVQQRRYTEAFPLLQQGLGYALQSGPDWRLIAEIWGNIATTYLRLKDCKQTQAALASMREAIGKLSEDSLGLEAFALEIESDIAAERQDFDEAMALAEQALDLASKDYSETSPEYLRKAQQIVSLQLRSGQLEEARATVQELVASFQSRFGPVASNVIHLRVLKARIFFHSGETDNACNEIVDILQLEKRALQASIAPTDSPSLSTFLRFVEPLHILAQWSKKALPASERASLVGQLIIELRGRILQQFQNNKEIQPQPDEHGSIDNVQMIVHRFATMRQNLASDSAILIIFRHVPPSSNLTKLAISWDRPYYTAIIATQEEAKWIDLGDAKEVEELLLDFRRVIIIRGNTSSAAKRIWSAFGERLHKALEKASKIYFLPDGGFETFWPNILRDAHNRPILDKAVWMDISSLLESNAPPKTLLNAALIGQSKFDGARDLKWIRDEILEIEAVLHPHCHVGKALDESDMQEALVTLLEGKPQLVHIATHGMFEALRNTRRSWWLWPRHRIARNGLSRRTMGQLSDPDPFMRCGILLDGAERLEIISGRMISKIDFGRPDLVILSCCDSSLGDIRLSEGALGLSYAVRAAGAQAVIAAQWSVPDRATKDLMTVFYRELIKGCTIAQALHSAQQHIAKIYKASYFWAGFIALGNTDRVIIDPPS